MTPGLEALSSTVIAWIVGPLIGIVMGLVSCVLKGEIYVIESKAKP